MIEPSLFSLLIFRLLNFRHLQFILSGVNVRSLCVVGFAGGGTPGHLFMGGGVF